MRSYIKKYKSNHNYTNIEKAFKYIGIDDNLLNLNQKYFLNNNGYLVLNNIFNKNECEEAINYIDNLCNSENIEKLSPVKENGCIRIDSLLYKNFNLFSKFILNKKILAAVKHVFNNDNFHLGSLTGRIVKPNYGEQNVHRDREFDDVKCSVNVIFVLSDFNENTGGTKIASGTHIPNKDNDLKYINAKMGSVVIINTFIKHCGSKNVSKINRYGMHGFYTVRDQVQTNSFRGLKYEDYNKLNIYEKYIIDHDPNQEEKKNSRVDEKETPWFILNENDK